MPSAATDPTLLARRLCAILMALCEGQELDPRSLAAEFGVSLRTIQRDLFERFAGLDLARTDSGGYRLSHQHLGGFSFKEMEQFTRLAGIRPLFPHLSRDFVRGLLDRPEESALSVKGPAFEALDGAQAATFRQIEQAVQRQRCIGFSYRKPEGEKHYPRLEPYRLIHHNGVWYLARSKLKCDTAMESTG